MKKITRIQIGLGFLFTAILAGIVFLQVYFATRHLIKTPPRKVRLHFGVNDLEFPVVLGRYLLRIGPPRMEAAAFRFAVKGTITTPSGRQPINEAYEPTDEILKKKLNGGYVTYVQMYLDVTEKKGAIKVHLEVSYPENKELECLFQGIK